MKTVVIIAEGMDPIVLEKEVEQGNLPWFSAQIKKENYRQMDCGVVPYEPSNLATAFAGVNPGKHGCFSYWACHSDQEWPKILDANDVRVPRIWEWSELSDLKFNIVNVQLTHPPKPINGKMISYLMNNTLNASYPRNLLSQLLKQGVRYAHDVSLFYKEGDSFDEFSEEAFRIAEYQLQTALELAKDSDILIVNLTLPDRLSHFLWYEMVDVNFEGRPKILKAYDFIDSACQQLQALASENVFVFSDTGFGELTEFVSINRYLQDAGLQKLNSDGTINLKQSFALETVQGSHGVMLVNDLNNKGEASPTQIDDLKKFLLEITFDDGTPVLAEANYREDIYQGDYTYLAPSFVVKPTDEKRPPLGDTRWASHVSRNSQSAWHRDKGFFIYDGSLTINNDTDEVKLQQVATSIAQASNRDPHAQCELASVF